MDLDARRTPCVGICSTTYGDLVCRGCKRFAHEIVSWNAYSPDQQSRVWRRLLELRDSATAEHVSISEPRRLALAAAPLGLPAEATQLTQVYQLLRRRSKSLATLADAGLRAVHDDGSDASAIRDRVDAEFLRRSIAVYERSFRVVVDE